MSSAAKRRHGSAFLSLAPAEFITPLPAGWQTNEWRDGRVGEELGGWGGHPLIPFLLLFASGAAIIQAIMYIRAHSSPSGADRKNDATSHANMPAIQPHSSRLT